jgi:hypothetical protein
LLKTIMGSNKYVVKFNYRNWIHRLIL